MDTHSSNVFTETIRLILGQNCQYKMNSFLMYLGTILPPVAMAISSISGPPTHLARNTDLIRSSNVNNAGLDKKGKLLTKTLLDRRKQMPGLMIDR